MVAPQRGWEINTGLSDGEVTLFTKILKQGSKKLGKLSGKWNEETETGVETAEQLTAG